MRANVQLQIVLTGLSFLLLNACATTPSPSLASFAEIWTNALGTVWTIHHDGTFAMDQDHDGKTDIRGNCSVSGDTFTIKYNQGKTLPKECEGPGVYKFVPGMMARGGVFASQDRTLTFKVISDDCKGRKKDLLTFWRTTPLIGRKHLF